MISNTVDNLVDSWPHLHNGMPVDVEVSPDLLAQLFSFFGEAMLKCAACSDTLTFNGVTYSAVAITVLPKSQQILELCLIQKLLTVRRNCYAAGL